MIEFWQTRIRRRKVTQLFLQTFLKWQQDNCLERGAALAYYALFSLFPIFLVILSVFGWFLGPDTDTYRQLLKFIREALPPEAYEIVANTLLNLNQSRVGAGLVGFILLLLIASKIFSSLDQAVDCIWQVQSSQPAAANMKQRALEVVKRKIVALILVFGTAVFLWLSLLSNIAIRVILEMANNFQQTFAWLEINELLLLRSLQTGIALTLLAGGVMILFKFLPPTPVKWGDVWLGAGLSGGLLLLLQRLVSSGIVNLGEQFQAYGAIGGVMVLLLWLYLTCQIFFLGCEFTYIYAHLFGSRRHR
jgi:membrane protein